jgi:hypothetical protein
VINDFAALPVIIGSDRRSLADKMKKLLIVGLSSAALIGATHINGSFAQTGNNSSPAQLEQKTGPVVQAERTGPPDNQIANEVDARIARLKAGLRLTSEQEKNWSGLQTALHEYGVGQFKRFMEGRSLRQDRRDREDQSQRNDRPNDIARMRNEADELTSRAASLKKLADAAEPLYGTLDDRQKRRLVQFMKTEF